MTVEAVAQRFGRHTSTVRGWLDKGTFPGAYKFKGREWRIPVASLAAFEDAARREVGTQVAATDDTRRPPSNLSDWRKKVSA
jgi:excisionase family DNA binding protein